MGKERKKGGSGNRSRDWKGREKMFGKAATGHGFALDKKSKAVKKYKKFSKKTGDKSHDERWLKPLAFDPLRDGKLEEVDQPQIEHLKKEKYSKGLNVSKRTKGKSVQMEYERKKKEKQQNRKDKERKRSEHDDKVRKGIERRQKLAQKLMKKTKKGQPVLANHIGHLLEKIKTG